VELGDLRFALLGAAVWFGASNANAFCRTTTCDADGSTANCVLDSSGCATAGHPLLWQTECLSFSVEQDGSPKRHVSFSTFDHVIQLAFQQWASADCGGGTHPSFRIWDFDQRYGPSLCNQPEYNDEAPNADTWMFQDAAWPYAGQNSTLALTTITFEVESGEILDADVEVNSAMADITTTDTDVHSDLQSIVTHEAGHFLGLAHSKVRTATMFASYAGGDTSFRTLSSDDVTAICAAYPPNRPADACSSPQPAHGFTRYCESKTTADPAKACSIASVARTVRERRHTPGALASAVGLWTLGTARRWRRARRSRT